MSAEEPNHENIHRPACPPCWRASNATDVRLGPPIRLSLTDKETSSGRKRPNQRVRTLPRRIVCCVKSLGWAMHGLAVSQKLFASRTDRWQRSGLARIPRSRRRKKAYGLGIGTPSALFGRNGFHRGQILLKEAPARRGTPLRGEHRLRLPPRFARQQLVQGADIGPSRSDHGVRV